MLFLEGEGSPLSPTNPRGVSAERPRRGFRVEGLEGLIYRV